MSWTVLAAAVTPMTTTACRAVAAVTVAMGAPAGGLAAPASHRPRTLCCLALPPACLASVSASSSPLTDAVSPWATAVPFWKLQLLPGLPASACCLLVRA